MWGIIRFMFRQIRWQTTERSSGWIRVYRTIDHTLIYQECVHMFLLCVPMYICIFQMYVYVRARSFVYFLRGSLYFLCCIIIWKNLTHNSFFMLQNCQPNHVIIQPTCEFCQTNSWASCFNQHLRVQQWHTWLPQYLQRPPVGKGIQGSQDHRIFCPHIYQR